MHLRAELETWTWRAHTWYEYSRLFTVDFATALTQNFVLVFCFNTLVSLYERAHAPFLFPAFAVTPARIQMQFKKVQRSMNSCSFGIFLRMNMQCKWNLQHNMGKNHQKVLSIDKYKVNVHTTLRQIYDCLDLWRFQGNASVECNVCSGGSCADTHRATGGQTCHWHYRLAALASRVAAFALCFCSHRCLTEYHHSRLLAESRTTYFTRHDALAR